MTSIGTAMRRITLLPIALGVVGLAPAAANAAPYQLVLTPDTAIRAMRLDPGGHRAFRLDANALRTDPLLVTAAGSTGAARISLPQGATFTAIRTRVRGCSPDQPGRVRGSYEVRSSITGRATTPFSWLLAATCTDQTSSATLAGADSIAIRMKAEQTLTPAGRNMLSFAEMVATVDDARAPTLDLAGTPQGIVLSTTLPIAWRVADAQSGPGRVDAYLDAGTTPLPVRTVVPPDVTRVTGQQSGGAATVAGRTLVELAAADGPHTVRVVARDASGNTTERLARITVDTRPPEVLATAPGGWCTAACRLEVVATDAVGVRAIVATANGVAIPLAVSGAGARMTATADLLATGAQGRVSVAVTATDAAGRRTSRTIDVLLDDRPPAIAVTRADPFARAVTVEASDASGIEGAVLRIADAELPLAPGAERGTYEASVPAGVPWPDSLDGVAATVEARDGTGHVATADVLFRARAEASLAIDSRVPRTVSAGASVRVVGHVASTGGSVGGRTVLLEVANPRWPLLAARRTVTTDATGGFSSTIRPRATGPLVATLVGDDELAPARTATRTIGVAPRIVATFSARRAGAGLARDLAVRGRVVPGTPALTLSWIAWRPGQRRAIAVPCAAPRFVSGKQGRIRARCRIAGPFFRTFRFAVAYTRQPGSPYVSVRSALRKPQLR